MRWDWWTGFKILCEIYQLRHTEAIRKPDDRFCYLTIVRFCHHDMSLDGFTFLSGVKGDEGAVVVSTELPGCHPRMVCRSAGANHHTSNGWNPFKAGLTCCKNGESEFIISWMGLTDEWQEQTGWTDELLGHLMSTSRGL